MMECGQYNDLWSEIHMFPEETVQASIDVKAKIMMPIHWGAFKLAMHPWKDPVERVVRKAFEMKMTVIVPRIGEPISVKKGFEGKVDWWEK